MERTLASRITEWAAVTVLGVAIGFGGTAIGLFDHPVVVAAAVSIGNVIGQCASAISRRRRRNKGKS